MGSNASSLFHHECHPVDSCYHKLASSERDPQHVSPVDRHHLPYCAIWSRFNPREAVPCPRTNHCSVYDPLRNEIFIAYGRDRFGDFLNDAWIFNISSRKWRCVSQRMLSPRHSASAVLYGRQAIIFGGLGKRGYFAELHGFDLDTHALTKLTPGGPAPRARQAMFASMDKIFICGGHCTRPKGDLHSFDFGTMEWRKHADPEFAPRVGTAWCSDGRDGHFVFGGGARLARFSTTTGEFTPICATGHGPDRHLACLTMAAFGSFLFVYGGGKTSSLWGLDLKSFLWSPIFIAPDNRSVKPGDGHVTPLGALELPRTCGETMVYSRVDGGLWRVLGTEASSRTPADRITVGRAVAALHASADMTAMLREF